MSLPNTFDVLKEMSRRDLRIHMSDQWCRVRKTKRGTQVTVGIGGDFVAGIADGRYIVAMYLVDLEQYSAVHEELGACASSAANAHLECAAPVLLAACKRVIERFGASAENAYYAGDIAVLSEVRAAILKAEPTAGQEGKRG